MHFRKPAPYIRAALSMSLLAFAAMPMSAADLYRFGYSLGGGISDPQHDTAKYAGVSGSITGGVGYNFDPHDSAILEFMWAGMPHHDVASQLDNAPFGKVNLYSLTANYRYKYEKRGSHFGVYAIGGGGWYYRYISVNASYLPNPNTACQPIYTWWGYGCQPNGSIQLGGMTYKFESAGGLNGGAGVTIRLSDSGWKFYTESRYHHGFSRIPTSLVLVTFGLRYH